MCNALDIANTADALTSLDEDEKCLILLKICEIGKGYTTSERNASNFTTGVSEPKTRARKTQRMLCISELGIYRLIMRSNKPEAKSFQKWVYNLLAGLREALGYEQYKSMLFAESAKNHNINMGKINMLHNPTKDAEVVVDKSFYIAVHSITNKTMGNICNGGKSIKKGELKERYPELVLVRNEIETETTNLTEMKVKYGLGFSVSETIQNKYKVEEKQQT